jgi:alkaline phosphatase D
MTVLHFYDREERPWPNARLSSASVIGHTTANTTRPWFRLYEPGEYWLVVSPSEIHPPSASAGQFAPVVLGSGVAARLVLRREGQDIPVTGRLRKFKVGYETDLTAVVDVPDLEPDKRYCYAVFFAGERRMSPWELGYDEVLAFRTHPSKPDSFAFGFFSCHMPYEGRNLVNINVWEALHEELTKAGGRFVIGAGDQVYVDGNPHLDIWRWLRKVKNRNGGPSDDDMVSWYRDIYRGYWGPGAVRKVLQSFPSYMICDDHEIMDGWGSYKKKELSDRLDTLWEWENRKRTSRSPSACSERRRGCTASTSTRATRRLRKACSTTASPADRAHSTCSTAAAVATTAARPRASSARRSSSASRPGWPRRTPRCCSWSPPCRSCTRAASSSTPST